MQNTVTQRTRPWALDGANVSNIKYHYLVAAAVNRLISLDRVILLGNVLFSTAEPTAEVNAAIAEG